MYKKFLVTGGLGFIGGKFLKRISDYLEAFDINKEI